MSQPCINKHYQIALYEDEVLEYPYELVVARGRTLTVRESVRVREVLKSPSLAYKFNALSRMAYCIEEACRRAIECKIPFPIQLHYKDVTCTVLSRDSAVNLSQNAFLNGGVEYCTNLFLLLES